MAQSCNIYAQCRNSQGEVVPSKLFKSLLEYSSNDRTFAKELYRVALNPSFLEKVRDRAQFDENGEITLKSLLELTKTDIEQEKILKSLNKEVGAGTFDFNTAVQKIQGFNRESEWKSDYIATIQEKNGKYVVSVQPRTAAAEQALAKTISNQTLQNRLINILAQHGVAVDFLQEGSSRYSTVNAVQNADGLYHLIQVVNGEHVTEELAEEAGHFAVAALGDSPLVQRLITLLTPEVQKEALGEEYNTKYLGKDSRREVAGNLVGKALAGSIDKEKVWSRLVQRIADAVKRIFYTIKGDEVRTARLEAERIADKIARGFMSADQQSTLENALKTKETLYNIEYSTNVQTYKEVITQLKSVINELRAMNSSLADRMQMILMQVQAGREETINTNIGVLADGTALSGIAESADLVLNLMSEEIPQILNSVDFNNTLDFASNMARNGHSLREAHMVTKRCIEIARIISEAISNDPNTNQPKLVGDLQQIQQLDPSTGTIISQNLFKLSDALSKFTSETVRNGFYSQLINKEAQFYLKFLEDSYGSSYVERGARAIFNFKNFNKRGKRLIEFKKPEKVTLEQLTKNLEKDISFFDRWFSSMANSGDIICEIVDKVTKEANKQADDITNTIWDTLKALKEELSELGISDSIKFYERDENGNLTGNLISSKLWGVWEQEYNDFMQSKKEEFLKAHEVSEGIYDFDNKTDFEKALMWQAYFESFRKSWHKEHSVFNVENGRWEPNDSYHNYAYDELTTEERQWLSKVMGIKKQLDTLTGNAMPANRAPQFKGTFMNKIRNKGSRLNPALYAKGIGEAIRDQFCVDVEDASEFGSTLTYNSEEEDMFGDQVAYEKEKLNRLPLFGINKLKNMNDLSTDIFHSMLAYASMATHYAAMNQIVDTVEIGADVLSRRKVKGTLREKDIQGNKSRVYNRYIKYLDKQVYGVSQPPIVIGRKIVLNKIANALSSLASKVFLGGNAMGGAVNFGTGNIELFKEALAGEFFTVKDWAKANAQYWASIPSELLHIGELSKEDKTSLLIRHFNILGNNKDSQKSWHTYKSRAANFIFGESLLLPYTAGDHYMQSIAYLALLNNRRVYTINGYSRSLYDAYEVTDITYTDDNGNTVTSKKYGKTVGMSQPYFKSREDIEEYKMAKQLLEYLQEAKNSANSVFGPVINLTSEQQQYLDNKGWKISNLDSTIGMLANRVENIPWNVDDESALMDMAREINDRMHGIYNDQDKTAFHQLIIGNMLLAMRGYALGMIQRRYGPEKYSVALGKEVEGTLITVFKNFAAMRTDNWGFGKSIRAFVMPFSKKVKADMEKAGFSSNQYANMRRNWGDMMLLAVLALIKSLTAEPDDDEDEKKELIAMYKDMGFSKEEIDLYMEDYQKQEEIDPIGLIYYFTSRLEREQAAFNWIQAIPDEWTQISSLTPAGLSVIQELGTTAYMSIGAQLYDYQELDNEYYKALIEMGYDKELVAQMKREDQEYIKNAPGRQFYYQSSGSGYSKGDPKWKRRLERIIPYYRDIDKLYHPYEAVKAFEYGRQVKVR